MERRLNDGCVVVIHFEREDLPEPVVVNHTVQNQEHKRLECPVIDW
jgi:hypothetical protein